MHSLTASPISLLGDHVYDHIRCTGLSGEWSGHWLWIFSWSLCWHDLQAITVIGKEEGIKGYWKGNLPQVFIIRNGFIGNWYFCMYISLLCWLVFSFVLLFPLLMLQLIRVIPYSVVQLFAYEIYKVGC